MRASYCEKYGGPDVYQFIDIDTPKPKANEILVKVYRAVVSPTDGNFRSGKPMIARLFSGIFKPKMKIHGEMFVGKVVEVGENIKSFNIGDMVYGTNGMKLGAYAEYLSVDIKNTIKKVPSDLNYKDVLPLLDGGITALPFLKELGNVKAGDTVLINGASGAVGSMAIMIAKHFKANVVGVCSTNNVDAVSSLGADLVIDYKKEDFTKNHNQYNIIFDTVGKSSYAKAKKSLKETGIYITTVPTPSVMLQAVFRKNSKKRRASFMAAGLRKPHVKLEDLAYLENLLRSKELKPLHGKVFNLEALGQAQTYVETGHKVGNVVISLLDEKEKEKMTYQESKSLTNILSTLIITGVYAIIVYQRVLNGIADTSDVFKFWAITILIFIPISIVARIIIMIIFSIINATIQTAKGEELDIDDIVDERDKLIELKSMRISLIIFSLGFILALFTQIMDMSHHMFFITMIGSGVISEVISDTTTILYYRKGV